MAGPVSRSGLDPFNSTVTDPPMAESNLSSSCIKLTLLPELLSIYLFLTKLDPTEVPQEILGHALAQVSKALLEATLEIIASDDILLMWCLLATESQGVDFQRTVSESQLSILARRSYIYSLMRTRLRDESIPSDKFIYAVGLAASVERKLGNTTSSEYHRRGLSNLFLLRGGIKIITEMPFAQSLMVAHILIQLDLPELYHYERRFPEAVEDLRLKLRQLQIWNSELRKPGVLAKRRLKDKTESSLRPGPDSSAHQESISAAYLEERIRTFCNLSHLDCIRPPVEELNDTQQRFYLGVLFTINSTLFSFKDNKRAGDVYLGMLMHSADLSTSGNFMLQCIGAKLPSLPMLFAVSQYVVETYWQ